MHIEDNSQAPQNKPEAVSEAPQKSNNKLESFLKFLIDRGFVDNEDDSSETIHRFLEIFEQFEEDEEEKDSSENDDQEGAINDRKARGENGGESKFETRAIFTMADFLKSLGPNEHYDIA